MRRHQVEVRAKAKAKLLRGGFRDGSGTSRLAGRAAGGIAFCAVQKLCQGVLGCDCPEISRQKLGGCRTRHGAAVVGCARVVAGRARKQ